MLLTGLHLRLFPLLDPVTINLPIFAELFKIKHILGLVCVETLCGSKSPSLVNFCGSILHPRGCLAASVFASTTIRQGLQTQLDLMASFNNQYVLRKVTAACVIV